MRQYRVHPYRQAAIVDGRLHWVVACLGDELLEVGDYEEAVALACKLASSEAAATGEDVEVVVESISPQPVRRILVPGKRAGTADEPVPGTSAA